MRIVFQGDVAPGVMVVSNEFIDHCMPSVSDAYVKVYFYLLRHRSEEVTDARIVNNLELMEGDMKHALLRWQREGLIAGDTGQDRLQETGNGYKLLKTPPEPEPLPENPEPGSTELILSPAKLLDKSDVDFRRLQDDSEFASLSYALQHYLSRTFSQTNIETVACLYGTFGISADLLIKLGECCAEEKKSSLRYLEKVALDWYGGGIRALEKAEQRDQSYTKEAYTVLGAFGIRNRGPGIGEQKFIEKWYREYAFSEELVVGTCGRTLRHVNKPSFPYVGGILTGRHCTGVHSMQDIAEENKKWEETDRREGAENGARKNGTRFHNFKEREEDPNDLMLQRLRRRLKQES